MNDEYTIYVNGEWWQCRWRYGDQVGVGNFIVMNKWNGSAWIPNIHEDIKFLGKTTDYNAREGWAIFPPREVRKPELAMRA